MRDLDLRQLLLPRTIGASAAPLREFVEWPAIVPELVPPELVPASAAIPA